MGWRSRVEHVWDAGGMGCGKLVRELKQRILEIPPGERIRVTARSPGAPMDLPAWCRLAGHTLTSAEPPVYVIERKAD